MKTVRPILPRLVLVAIVAIATCFQLEAAISLQRPIVAAQPAVAEPAKVESVAPRESQNNNHNVANQYLQPQLVSAALEQEKPERSRILVKQQPLLLPEEKAREHRKLKKHSIPADPKGLEPSSSKFLILTTGDKIKLYPFESSTAQFVNQLNLSSNYYEIRSTFEVDDDGSSATLSAHLVASKQVGNSTFARYLAARKLLSLRSSSSSPSPSSSSSSSSSSSTSLPRSSGQARSILPASHDTYDEDEALYAGQTGWQRPWITDIDYFFDANFCPGELGSGYQRSSRRHCLVIVWLDKSNKYVRFGSLDLTKNRIESMALPRSSSASKSQPVLLLQEFPPIELFRRPELRQATNKGQVFSMVVDRKRSMLHVALSDGSQPTPNRILTGKLGAPTFFEDPIKQAAVATAPTAAEKRETYEEQLIGERLLSFNHCLSRKQHDFEEASFENLNVDEENGNWLFYFDKHSGGKIFALNLLKQSASRLHQSSAAIQALVRDVGSTTLDSENYGEHDKALAAARWPSISNNDITSNNLQQESTNGITSDIGADPNNEQLQSVANKLALRMKARNATGMAVDPKQRLIYWLDEANELFSCNYAGQEAKLVGRLSARPAIRDPNAMQVFQGALYLSDPIKKSLIAYTLPRAPTTARSTEPSTDDNNHRRDISEQPEIRATHQVLLVEMPTLYGFRLVDIEALEAELTSAVGCIDNESSASSGAKDDSDLLKGVYASIGGDTDGSRDEDRDEQAVGSEGPTDRYAVANLYEEHLLDRLAKAGSSNQCGYEQSDYERRMNLKHDGKFLFLFLELCILLLAFVVWFSYPWIKAKLSLLYENLSNSSRNRSNSKTEFCKHSDLMFKCPV